MSECTCDCAGDIRRIQESLGHALYSLNDLRDRAHDRMANFGLTGESLREAEADHLLLKIKADVLFEVVHAFD